MITIKQVKKTFTLFFALVFFALGLTSAAVPTRAEGDEIAATYKAKCGMCHGTNAEKSFEATKADDVLIDAVVKGVKPKMPSYEQKLSADQAKQLVAYMKSLRK